MNTRYHRTHGTIVFTLLPNTDMYIRLYYRLISIREITTTLCKFSVSTFYRPLFMLIFLLPLLNSQYFLHTPLFMLIFSTPLFQSPVTTFCLSSVMLWDIFLSEFDFEKEVTQLSEIEKIKLINSESNRFSSGSKSWLLSEEFNGTEDKQTSSRQITQLLKFVVFPYMFIVFFFCHKLSYLLLWQ